MLNHDSFKGFVHQASESHHPRVAAALRMLDDEYRNPNVRLRDVARQVNLSPWHLNRLLTRETGLGFRDHLREKRLENACTMLRQANLSIKEIAYNVGYKHVTQLDRHFKARFGATPSQWRRSLLHDQRATSLHK